MERWPLRYDHGPIEKLDCPAHVRAASALVRLGEELIVVQDDSRFLARIHRREDGLSVRALPLPAGPGGLRLFGDDRGNKHLKLDLEAALVVDLDGIPTLVALGSGSLPARERILVVPWAAGEPGPIRLLDGSALYRALREILPGQELNIEAAFEIAPGMLAPGMLRLLQRGNGRNACNTSLDLPLSWLLDLLRGEPVLSPALRTRTWDLGEIGGVRLGFTGAEAIPGGWLYTAAAEDSPDAIQDGAVTGSFIGRVDARGTRQAPLRLPSGEPVVEKVEGLAPGEDPDLVYLVTDPDAPDRPAELLLARLEGPW